MRIELLCVGKNSFKFVEQGMQMYRERLSHYCRYSTTYIADLKGTSSLSKEQIKEREGELILKELKRMGASRIILLDERGERFTSTRFAENLQKRFEGSDKVLCFVIGGAYGFSDKVYNVADAMLSLSDMTFSHQIVRLIFIEQLYRAFTIMKGEPYHHE